MLKKISATQVVFFQFCLLSISSSNAGLIDSARLKWNARWMNNFKKEINYSENSASAASLIIRYDSLQQNIVEQRQLIEETGKKIAKEKRKKSTSVKGMVELPPSDRTI